MTYQLTVPLSISADELLKYYRGQARKVHARAVDGRRIEFPVDALKPFVTHAGVQGVFVLTVDQQQRLQRIERQAG